MSVKVLSKTSNPGTATLRAVSPPHVVSEVWKGAPRQWKGRGGQYGPILRFWRAWAGADEEPLGGGSRSRSSPRA